MLAKERLSIRPYHRDDDDFIAALAYDATMVIARAALEVGADRARIRDYLATIGTTRPAMTGVTGPIAFDEQNDPVNKPVVIATVGR